MGFQNITFYGLAVPVSENAEPGTLDLLRGRQYPNLTVYFRFKIFFHGNNYDALHQQVNRSALPSEYKGWLGSIEDMNLSNVIPGHARNIFDATG